MSAIIEHCLRTAGGHLQTVPAKPSAAYLKRMREQGEQLQLVAKLCQRILWRGSPDIDDHAHDDYLSDEQVEANNLRLFTPQIFAGVRLRLYVAKDEQLPPRGDRKWKGVVTDAMTGQQFMVRGASCGLRCYCAAKIVEVLP